MPRCATRLSQISPERSGARGWLALAFALGEDGDTVEEHADEPVGEEKFLELLKETFDATEREQE